MKIRCEHEIGEIQLSTLVNHLCPSLSYRNKDTGKRMGCTVLTLGRSSEEGDHIQTAWGELSVSQANSQNQECSRYW